MNKSSTIIKLVQEMINEVAVQTEPIIANAAECSTNAQISKQTLTQASIPTYRMIEQTMANSQSDSSISLSPPNPRPTILPPSYSSVLKMGPPAPFVRRIRSAEGPQFGPQFTPNLRNFPPPPQFSGRIPPPSYAEVHQECSVDLSRHSSETQMGFGPDPTYMWCNRCRTIVITETQSQRSKFTHFAAAALCLFGCWPCCLVPYFLDSCKNTYHFCPECNHMFGMYRPW